MEIVNEPQGSDGWLAERAKCFTASEAPAMMGASKHAMRTELLRQKATGITREVDAATQSRFDAGHAAEAAACYIAEDMIGDNLSPLVGRLTVDGLPLLASFDGITQDRDVVWENKLWNAALADQVRAGELEPHYYWQLEQQLLVSGAKKVFFTVSDGTLERTIGMWYESVPERRAKLIAGWKQFQEDLAGYQHAEAVVAPVATPIKALPALIIQVEGKVLATNLDQFKVAAQEFIANINTDLQTDQDFADADKMTKFLKDGEERLALCKSQALAQTASIDELFRTVDAISEQMRGKRLMLDKLVKAEKENRRNEILRYAEDEYKKHIANLNNRMGGEFMPVIRPPFAEAIKGLKSLDSMHDKVSAALASAKIEASEMADRIDLNAKAAKDHMHLLPDFAGVCAKASDDFAALVSLRVSQDQQRKEAEREKIRKEEAERITKEAARADAQAKAHVANDQREKADAGVGLSPDGRAQPVAASIPPTPTSKPVYVDERRIDDFLALLPATPTTKSALRITLIKWEKYRVACEREATV